MDSWRIENHKNEIKKGDVAIIWASGKYAGIYAIAEITSDPHFMPIPSESERYWIDQDLKKDSTLRVEFKIIKNLIDKPIMRKKLLNIPELIELSILKFAQKTNFPVTKSEWEIIKKLI
jgi:predicted RNA-binding protein with PUA-like domain